ncbi:PR domain zinc finger protein 5-like [Neocloeon triangulifer]|uniref:PR domain zinc finger protein 5-like n=1 Tax=Neocloeon triangulifer TaxID=2078957 RepID=UPI00286F4103|nr:PR domain zinc finger protein 5-like [Neocloeon triangulifer]
MWPELCRLCERPAAEGGYRGAELDLQALAEWCLNYLGTTLADEVKDEDLFCFFCVWDARFLQETMVGPESDLIPCWWPDEKIKDSKLMSYENFKVGKLQQCWVTLQKLPLFHESATSEINLDKPKFQCIYCIKSFLCKSKKNFHIKVNHGTIAIRCNYNVNCSNYFLSMEERDLHIKEFHLKSKVPVLRNCIYCERKDFTRTALWVHIKRNHTDVALVCPKRCAKKHFKSENELKIHLETHHKSIEEKKRFKCSSCNYRAMERGYLKSHEVKVHHKLVPLSFKCLECPATFISNASLRSHNSYYHKYRDCIHCKMRISFGYFNQHCYIVGCRVCKIKFNCRGLLDDHKLKGCPKPSYSCEYCLKAFEKKINMQYHLFREHLQVPNPRFKDCQHKCKICFSSFKLPGSLKKHIFHKHSIDRRVQCFHCQKIFARKRELTYHLADKHDCIENKFSCQFCLRKFFTAYLLKRHTRTHDKKAKCFVCNKYMLPKSLTNHFIIVHKIKPQKLKNV